MDIIEVDMAKSHELTIKLLKHIREHLKTQRMNTAEIAIALNEVAYHIGNASKIQPQIAG